MNPNIAIKHTAVDKAAALLQDKLDRLLAKAKPSKRDMTQQNFRNLYPKLEEHLTQGKPLKDVLAAFNTLTQANVCLRTFKEMLASERDRRDNSGDPVCCHTCGQSLKPAHKDGSFVQTPNPSEANATSSTTIELE